MTNFMSRVVSLWVVLTTGVAHASFPVYADGDLAPLGGPDGRVNAADHLIMSRLVLEEINPTPLEYAHGDLYPAGAPDGIINIQDLLLLQQWLFAPSANQYVENLDLFVDGPATLSATVDGNTAYTTATVGGWTGPGAVVVSDPYFTDPEDPANTVWYVSISDGSANVYLGTADLSAHSLLDSGFDLSGGSHASYGGSTTPGSGTFADEYHVFGVEWDGTTIRWLLDGVQYHAIDITPAGLSEFHEDFFFIFNVAVGGNWPGSPDGTTYFTQRMLVDYIRVFEKL